MKPTPLIGFITKFNSRTDVPVDVIKHMQGIELIQIHYRPTEECINEGALVITCKQDIKATLFNVTFTFSAERCIMRFMQTHLVVIIFI